MILTSVSLLKLSAGVCISLSLALSSCDDEKQKGVDKIQKAHQAKIENCAQHSNPQACIDSAIEGTEKALDAYQMAWAATEAKNYQSKEDFKRGLMEEIMNIVDPVLREFLLRLVNETVAPKNLFLSMLGQATISGLPVMTDAELLVGSKETMEASGLLHGDGRASDYIVVGPGPEPVLIVNKLMNIAVDAEFEMLGETQLGTLSGSVIVQVGQGITGPRIVRVVSGTLTLNSAYAGMGGSPIIMTVKKGGRSRMTVMTEGHTVLRLDLDAASHPLSFAYDESPLLEIPMLETTHENFAVNMEPAPFEYIHAWEPWPVSDFNKDGQYDAADVSAFTAALATQDPRTDLNMDGMYTIADIDLFLGYHAEDMARWQFQSDRFDSHD